MLNTAAVAVMMMMMMIRSNGAVDSLLIQ